MTTKTKHPIPVRDLDDEELFDDCPICQAMKKAQVHGYDLSYDELRAAFVEANRQQSKTVN